jgi:hypothetical protein
MAEIPSFMRDAFLSFLLIDACFVYCKLLKNFRNEEGKKI